MQTVMGNLAISHSAINYKRDASLKFPSSQKSTKSQKQSMAKTQVEAPNHKEGRESKFICMGEK